MHRFLHVSDFEPREQGEAPQLWAYFTDQNKLFRPAQDERLSHILLLCVMFATDKRHNQGRVLTEERLRRQIDPPISRCFIYCRLRILVGGGLQATCPPP